MSVKSRLGNTARSTGYQCGYCGADDHAQATAKERNLYCPAFGTSCGHCGKMNHFAEMCRINKSDAYIIIIKEVVDKDTGKPNGETK